eukprot:CAMPEP_0204533570 /NCGR_PEP_ID=MMETSP0661-20131031/12360_1 /ASSEMBLY_ACC=CAM_ASM_000606 /TAXON_ID=109239 /ORGANISM="Alexandrium margalefi, Strain AMGDE01CS-322" /LENGTH=640 /DNA_ID=CAMNT_0051539927 /DNA_START=66 /DNA_END=1988 /DNA_ORIENTATION=-
MPQNWSVVGGADKGGILVRTGQATTSKQADERLSTGALIEELELVNGGERLHYKLLRGTGPAEGWVATKVPGKDLVVKTDETLDGEGGGEAASDAKPADAGEPAAGDDAPPAVVVERPKEPGDDRKLARCQRELERPPVFWQRIDQTLVEQNHMRKAPGMIYGLEFPWNEATLEEMGPEWLTTAMHTVGSLPEDNKVTKIILEQKIKVTTGNNGGKFLFEVEYEKEDPTLHTKLFAKVPFALEGATKSDRMSSSVNKQPAELYEINTYRLLEATLPMKTPTLYFGDISNETSNWIIITERVAFKDFDCNNFGKPTKEKKEPLPAYQVEGPYDKCIDYNLRGNEKDYYACLIHVGAKMAGLSKAGKLGNEDLMKVSFAYHPDPNEPMMWGLNPNGSTGENPKQYKAKLDFALNFMTDTGKVLFQKYVPKDPFINKFRKTMSTLSAYSAELNYWKFKDYDYVALGHMNLNVDNAYFWRDESGKLDCGVFDWGNMGSGCMGHKLWWWLYCRDYENFKRHLSNDLKLFIESYHGAGGPLLDKKKLEQMVILTAMEQMHGLIAAVPQIYKMCPKKEWPTIKDRYDSRIAENIDGKSTIRLYLHVMNSIMRIIEEMKGDKVLDAWIKDVYEGEFKQAPKTEAMIYG